MTATLMSAILLAGLLLTCGFTLFILMDAHDSSYRDFAVLGLFCSILIMLSYYVELNTPGFAAKIDAIKFGYVGKVFVNPLLMMLALRYYDSRFSKVLQGGLFIIPIITLSLVFTCERQSFYYTSIEMTPDGLIHIEPGFFYFIYIGYNTLLSLTYICYLLYQRAGLSRRDKTTNALLLSACVIPLFSLLSYLSGWTNGYDLTSTGVMAGSLIISIAIFRYGLLNKDEILQNMATGLVFLDDANHLVYANRAAIQIIPVLGKQSRMHPQDLSALVSPEFDSITVGTSTYQRKLTEWSNGEGQHGKLITFDDITEIRARLNRDAMTGLLNHATFYPMLDDALLKTKLSGQAISVSIADIDSFKRINDNYGHANGDTVLIALANTLEEICSLRGDVFRYGGEEFAVIFYCDEKLAESTMQKALKKFAKIDFDFLPYHVTFSYGSAQYNGSETSVALFDRADQLMYQRKKALHAREQAEAEEQV